MVAFNFSNGMVGFNWYNFDPNAYNICILAELLVNELLTRISNNFLRWS